MAGPGTDSSEWAMDVTPAVLGMVPRSMNAAGCASCVACPLAAASFAVQKWKLAVDTDSSRQKAAMVLPLCAGRYKRLRRAASFEV